jgi:hypothetical protein
MPSTVVEQSKGSRTFLLGTAVYADSTTLSSNILPVSFGVFKFQEFVAENTRRASEYYGLRSFQLDQSTAVITSSPKDPTIPKEVNDADEWREVEGIIETQSKYARKAFRVDLTVRYKTAAAAVDASTEARDAEIAAAVDARVEAALQAAGLPTKAAADEEVGSSGEDHEGVVEEVIGKKKRSTTTTKMQKEAAERRERAEVEGKHIYPLYERHRCLRQHCKNKKHGVTHCLEFESKHYPLHSYHLARWSEAIEEKKATLDFPDLPLLSKIRYSERMQDREDKKDTKSDSYKHRRGNSSSTNESISSPPRRRRRRGEAYTTVIQSPANPIPQQDQSMAFTVLMNQMQQQNQQMIQQMQNAIQAAMPPSVRPAIANSYFTVDPTPNTRSSSVPSLQSAPSVPASSSETPTHHYPPPTTPTSLLPSSPARSDIEQSNSKLSAFTKWLQSHYPVVASAFAEAESILIEEDYNFKLLKHALLDSSMGHTKLHRIGLTYGLIDRMVNCLEDFRTDWRRSNAAAEALLDVSIGKHPI